MGGLEIEELCGAGNMESGGLFLDQALPEGSTDGNAAVSHCDFAIGQSVTTQANWG